MAITNKKKGSILLNHGIDVSKPAEYIDDSSLRNSINFEIKRNILQKRDGESALGSAHATAPTEIMTGRQFVREGTKYNIRVGLDKIEKYNVATSAWVDITGSDLTGTTSDLHCTAVPLLSGKRILCIANGIDAIRKWTATGNTANLGGTPPIPKFIQEYKTYLVCANIAGGTDISQRVQWSDTADPETWSGGNSGSVDLVEDGGDITGLNIFGDYLAVHKKSSIYLGYLVSSTSIFQFNRKSTGSGTVANNSIVNLPSGEQIFLASDGLRLFNGISAPLIESPVNDEIRDELNPEYDYKAWGVLVKEKDEVWMGIPLTGHTVGDTIYKFNYITRTLYKDSRNDSTVAWLGSASESKTWDDYVDGETWDNNPDRWNERALSEESDQINFGHTDGTVTIVDASAKSDSGSNINAYIETKDFQSAQDVISRWKKMELWAKGGDITVEYSTDSGNNWTEVTDSPLTLSTDYPSFDDPDILYFDTVSSKIRFRFSNDSNDESLAIKQFIIEYSERENRR